MQSSQISFNFRGKKAIVTGGSRGIGRDIVRALAEANCEKIYVIARDKVRLEQLKKDFACVVTVPVDLRDWDATRKAVDNIEPVEFLVNSAAILNQDYLNTTAKEEIDEMLDVNVKAIINISQIVCAKMLEKGKGSVVHISSLSGIKAIPGLFSYTAGKCALDGITRHMAMELAPKVRVNSVLPNVTKTEMGASWANADKERYEKKMKGVPMGRMVELEEVSNATLFLLSEAAGMTTGHLFPVTGGEY